MQEGQRLGTLIPQEAAPNRAAFLLQENKAGVVFARSGDGTASDRARKHRPWPPRRNKVMLGSPTETCRVSTLSALGLFGCFVAIECGCDILHHEVGWRVGHNHDADLQPFPPLGGLGVAFISNGRTISPCLSPRTVTRTPVLSFVKDGRGWIHSSLIFVCVYCFAWQAATDIP